MKDIGYTITVIVPNSRTQFVFLKFFQNLELAANWARDEIAMRDAEHILIRIGQYASDPVVWDSRTAPKPVPYCWTHRPVPASFPLQCVNERFVKRASSVLGDYDSKPDFRTWTPGLIDSEAPDGYEFTDHRYFNTHIRMAWMMYLDLALEHFDRFGAVV